MEIGLCFAKVNMRVAGSNVIVTISGTDLKPDEVKAEIEQRITEIDEWLGFLRQTYESFPADRSEWPGAQSKRGRPKLKPTTI